MINPWNIKSVYELQYFVCPSCVFKDPSKQNIINHAYEFHPESIDYLVKIKDDSFTDIICPWDTIKIKDEIEANMVDSSMVEVHIKTEESHEDFPLNSKDLNKEKNKKIKEEINSDIDEEINKVELDNDIYYDDKHNFDEDEIDPLVPETSIKSENIEDNIYWSR